MRLLLERKALTSVYNALALPRHSYCCKIWADNYNTINKTEKYAKGVIRIMMKVEQIRACR